MRPLSHLSFGGKAYRHVLFLGYVAVLVVCVFLTARLVRAQTVSVQSSEASAPAFAQAADPARYVSYFDTSEVAYYYPLPDNERARLTMRFSPPIPGRVDSIFFALNGPGGGNPSPVFGEGRLRIRLADTMQVGGFGTNAVIVPRSYRDSASVPLSALQPGAYNAVDVPDVAVSDTADYIAEFDVIASSDSASVQFVLDGGSGDSEDENYFPARTHLFRAFPDTTGYFTFVCPAEAPCSEDETENANIAVVLRIEEKRLADEVQNENVPGGLVLAPIYPNPFHEATTLPFVLERPARVVLSVYDVLGRRVATLVDGRRRAGEHAARWQAAGLSAGVYVVRLRASGAVRTQAITVVR